MSQPSTANSRSTVEIAKDSAIEHLSEAASTARDAITSGGWTYPLLGILHLITHAKLFKSLAPSLIKSVVTALGVTLGLFVFTYIPQVAFFALFSGPLAFAATVPVILGESYIVTTFVSKYFFLAQVEDQLFDAVLLQQGSEDLVAKGRHVSSTKSGTKKLGQTITQPFNRFNKESIIRYVVSLPLNALPVVGTILFLLYNGQKAGPTYHARYFQLKEFDESKRKAFVQNRHGAYVAFGATALGLQLVPVVGLLFRYTSIIGAALWASQIERKNIAGPNIAPVPEENEVPVEM